MEGLSIRLKRTGLLEGMFHYQPPGRVNGFVKRDRGAMQELHRIKSERVRVRESEGDGDRQ